MYKVLLVDDERLELNTLKNYVDWNKMGIGTVYTANNGLQALETAQYKKPDLRTSGCRLWMESNLPDSLGKRIRE